MSDTNLSMRHKNMPIHEWGSMRLQYTDVFMRASAFFLKIGGMWSQFLDDIKSSENFKFRVAGIAAATALGIFALVMGLSLLGAVFGIRTFNPLLGSFFSHSYGILAFFVPIYLGYAAYILIDPRWRPEKIFTLNVSILPFLTLGIGFILMRDFEGLAQGNSFLYIIGRTGFGILIVTLTFVQVIGLQALMSALFPPAKITERRRVWKLREQGPFLPAPKTETAPEEIEGQDEFTDASAQKTGLTEAYIDASYVGEWVSSVEPNAGKTATYSREESEINLSVVRPFRGPIAIEYLGDTVSETGTLNEASVKLDEGTEETALPLYERSAEVVIEDITEDDFTIDDFDADVERALEEAEAAAAIHSEEAAKKPARPPVRSPQKNYGVPLEILNQYPDGEYWIIDQATRGAAVTLKETLQEFKIQAEVTGIRKGPVVTMFEILPAAGVKLSRIVNLQDNIALRLAASSVRIVAPIPGKHAVGIEVPNAKRNIVSFREIIEWEMQREGKRPEIPVVMGKDIGGEAQTIDLTQTPHLLIAGATGAGKSVCVNSMILSILYRLPPSNCRLILIDPKIVELKLYNDIPHLLTPVITEPKRAFQALQWCIYEMERRYACLDSLRVRDIRNYNKRIKERNIAQEKMPYIVIIIDEFADLMATTGKELESTVARLAAMSRAVGIHLVLATQRPSIDVITGLIKANIPSRIAFMVASKMDSRIIIDMVGAEKLLGKGDMLYAGVVDPFPTRMQGAFVSEDEVEAVVAHVKTLGAPDYIDDEIFFDDEESADPAFLSEGDDPLYDKALEIVVQQGKASASYIQRRLKIGYNRAARLVEIMEHQGVVGPAQGSKPRELLRGV